jgi:hypothetical protein
MIGGALRVDSGASEEGVDADIIYVWEAARCSSLNIVLESDVASGKLSRHSRFQ